MSWKTVLRQRQFICQQESIDFERALKSVDCLGEAILFADLRLLCQ
jgi:hypothetical protein